jgi:hypothetical protein
MIYGIGVEQMRQLMGDARPSTVRRWRRALLGALALGGSAVVFAGCPSHETVNYLYETTPHWPAKSIVPADPNGFLITTNNGDDTLSWIDLVTLAPKLTLPVGLNPVELEGPHHITTSLDGKFIFVGVTETFPTNASGPHGSHGSGAVPGYVLKIRVSDGAVVGQVRVDRSPGDLILSPDGTKVYVSHFDIKRILDQTAAGGTEASKFSGIAVIDTATMTRTALVMVCPAEHGMTTNAAGTKLYVSCYGNDSVAVVDLTQATLPSVVVPAGANPGEIPGNQSYQPYAATMSSDGKFVWFSCWGSGDIRAFDTATNTFDPTRVVHTGGFPVFGDAFGDRMIFGRQSGDPLNHDDHVFLVGSDGSQVADWFYPPTQCINAHMVKKIPGQPGKGALLCEGDHVHGGSALRIDLGTGAVEATSAVGVFPDGEAFVGGGAP